MKDEIYSLIYQLIVPLFGRITDLSLFNHYLERIFLILGYEQVLMGIVDTVGELLSMQDMVHEAIHSFIRSEQEMEKFNDRIAQEDEIYKDSYEYEIAEFMYYNNKELFGW